MGRKRTDIQWQILLDDEHWDSERCPVIPNSPNMAPPARKMTPRQRCLLWAGMAAIVVAVISVGYLLWRRAQAGLEIIETELEEAIALEYYTQEDQPTFSLTETPALPPTVVLEEFDLNGERACIAVVVDDPALPLPYRETRFYQQTDLGWQRTPPTADFWGASQSLESEYFIFIFAHRDLAVVAELAPALDEIYAEMRQDLGLPVLTDTQLPITISTDTRSTHFYASVIDGRLQSSLELPSPQLLRLPVETSEAEALMQLAVDPLASHLLIQKTRQWTLDGKPPYPHPLDILWSGTRLWLVWEHKGLLANQHEEIIRLLYADTAGTAFDKRSLPATYRETCQICDMVGVRPAEMALPFLCKEDFTLNDVSFYTLPILPARLASLPIAINDAQDLAEYHAQSQSVAILNFLTQRVAAFTLIDYIVDTYGQEQLPLMLDRVGSVQSWEMLAQTAFGISAAELEAGWNQYLADKYTAREARPWQGDPGNHPPQGQN